MGQNASTRFMPFANLLITMTSQHTIVLIEDEVELVRMYQEMFRRHSPHAFVHVSSKAETLDMLRRLTPSLILLDLIIPERPGEAVSYEQRVGFDLLTQIRKKPATKDIRVLVFSNMDSHEDRMRSEELGVSEYLLKAEYTPQRLVEKINRYLSV